MPCLVLDLKEVKMSNVKINNTDSSLMDLCRITVEKKDVPVYGEITKCSVRGCINKKQDGIKNTP